MTARRTERTGGFALLLVLGALTVATLGLSLLAREQLVEADLARRTHLGRVADDAAKAGLAMAARRIATDGSVRTERASLLVTDALEVSVRIDATTPRSACIAGRARNASGLALERSLSASWREGARGAPTEPVLRSYGPCGASRTAP